MSASILTEAEENKMLDDIITRPWGKYYIAKINGKIFVSRTGKVAYVKTGDLIRAIRDSIKPYINFKLLGMTNVIMYSSNRDTDEEEAVKLINEFFADGRIVIEEI